MTPPTKYEKRVIKVAVWGFVSQEIGYHSYAGGGSLTYTKGFELTLRAHVSRLVEEDEVLDLSGMVNEIGKTSLKFARALIENAEKRGTKVIDEKILEETLAQPFPKHLFPFMPRAAAAGA